MPSSLVLPETIIKYIDAYANTHGEETFPHNGRLHFWSGPRDEVWNLTAGIDDKNGSRGVRCAKDHGAMVIAESPIGQYLKNFMGVGTFNYYRFQPSIPPEEKWEYAIRPWIYASHLFALSAYGQVTTTVCGANHFSVYYSKELPNILHPDYIGLSATAFLTDLSTPRKKEVETINLIPFERILDAWDDDGIEAAHSMICIGEQRMSLGEARERSHPDYIRQALKLAAYEVLTNPTDLYKDFLESQEFFLIDLALQKPGTKFSSAYLRTPVFRQTEREERLYQFATNVISVIEAEIATMPSTARPAYAIPPYVRRVAPR